MRRTAALLAALAVLGCGDDDAEPAEEQASEVTGPEEPPEGHGDVEEPPPEPEHDVRVGRLEGEVRVNGEEVAAGAGVPPGARITTGEGARAVLDRRGGGRLELGPGTVAVLDRAAELELVVARGRARGIMPPEGNTRRPPLRIGGPAASAEIGGSGDVWLEVAPDGRTWVATLSGRADVDRGALDDDGHPVRRTLGPGRAVLVADELPEESGAGPAREQEAPAAAAEALGEPRDPDVASLTGAYVEAGAELREVLDRIEAEAQEGDRLAQRHRTTAGLSRESARQVQRELVAHSQRVLRLRTAMLTRWERVHALAVALELAGGEPDPDPSSFRDRVLRAMGVQPDPP